MALDLTIDVTANRLTIGTREIGGRHRWEAACLAALIQSHHDCRERGCGVDHLQSCLARFGQQQPLTRKQFSRLWVSVEHMFELADKAAELRERFGFSARCKTVGPWWWASRATDRIRISGSAAETSAPALPALATTRSPRANATLCRTLLLCHGAMIDGRQEAAIELLRDPAAWADASIELSAYRHLRECEAHVALREMKAAAKSLASCARLLRQGSVCARFLAPTHAVLRARVSYSSSPTRNHSAVARAMEAMSADPAIEVDRFATGLRLNLQALCRRRVMEMTALRDIVAAERHLESALDLWFAAFFCFVTTGQHEYAQNVCSNVAYLLHRAFAVGLKVAAEDALDWYAVAISWQNRFDLADNNIWELIYLGDFWLYVPAARDGFDSLATRVSWDGLRPDTLAFYEHGLKKALRICEPRQIAHSALNLWHFARESRLSAPANRAASVLRDVLAEHRDVKRILREEGYHLPRAASRSAGRGSPAPVDE